WRFGRGVISLRYSFRKEKMQNVFNVLSGKEIAEFPMLQVELVFREFFGIRLSIKEIQFLLQMRSSLRSFNNYKFGLRHVTFNRIIGDRPRFVIGTQTNNETNNVI